MEFILKYPRILLEIYPKGEFGSTLQNVNDNSEFVEIVKTILDENDGLVGCDLNLFLEKINNLSSGYISELKNYIIDLHGQIVWDEFYNYYILSHTFKFKEFFNKYNIDSTYAKILGKIMSVNSVVNYINSNITIKHDKTIGIFDIDIL